MTFEQMVAEMVEKKMAKGLSLEAAVAELAAELKPMLMESGLYEELRAKAQAIAAAEAPKVAAALVDRNSTIKAIKAALKARGLTYSVTGGHGTTWGWITIDLMPKMKNKCLTYSECREARGLMNEHFGLEGFQYISIPPGNDYYREYMDRAAGREPKKLGVPYWD